MNNIADLEIILDVIVAVVACIALFISIFAYLEAKKTRIESQQSKLVMNLVNYDGELFVSVSNIGQVVAYDVSINTSEKFRSLFNDIHLIPPSVTYRYSLMRADHIGGYPNNLIFNVSYRDIYCPKRKRTDCINFDLLKHTGYIARWNSDQQCYDISRL